MEVWRTIALRLMGGQRLRSNGLGGPVTNPPLIPCSLSLPEIPQDPGMETPNSNQEDFQLLFPPTLRPGFTFLEPGR